MNCYFTLDYELCLGNNTGSANGCLVTPMNELSLMLNRYDIKVNIMVDTAYLLRMELLKEYNHLVSEEYNIVVNNLRFLSNQGHSLQFHFHPQWLYSNFVNGKWQLDKEHYKLSDLEKTEMLDYLEKGIDLLNSISGKKVKAFRAGGFSVENFNDISRLFLKKGITIDSSVLRYAKTKTKYHSYNYTRIPKKTSYRFNSNMSEECPNGFFTEFPISVKPYNCLQYLIKKWQLSKRTNFLYSNRRWNNGTGIGYPGGRFNALIIKIKKLFKRCIFYASFDGNLSFLLPEIYQYTKKNYSGNDFVILSHPKLFTPLSIHLLEQFIIQYKDEIHFATFDQQ